ncbi:MAG: hypothetical protein B6229_10230 [Spirochaetaceae bacterium 4572_7]|nr:MAG: hypothetical protein B6229_10230 [Spirochaetaceae bacterium 4572_7]
MGTMKDEKKERALYDNCKSVAEKQSLRKNRYCYDSSKSLDYLATLELRLKELEDDLDLLLSKKR